MFFLLRFCFIFEMWRLQQYKMHQLQEFNHTNPLIRTLRESLSDVLTSVYYNATAMHALYKGMQRLLLERVMN